MNRKLFEVRPLKVSEIKGVIFVLFVLIISVFFLVSFFTGSSFISKFKGAFSYSPLNNKKEFKGFYGKTDSLLNKALKDTTDDKYSPITLDSHYKRLKFYVPTLGDGDSKPYMPSFEDVRLIDFIPDPNNEEETEFFINSDFKNLLEKQKKNLSQAYFNIKWDKSHVKIVSIHIDTTLFTLSLSNNKWNGTIQFQDPFAKVDTGVFYFICEKQTIPIFSSTLSERDFETRQDKSNNSAWFYISHKSKSKEVKDYRKIHETLNDSINKNFIRIIYGQNERNYIGLLNHNNDSLSLIMNNIDLTVYTDNSKPKHYNMKNSKRIRISKKNKITKLEISENGNSLNDYKRTYTAYITRECPFALASKPIYEGKTIKRLNVDTSYLDLFARQEIRQIETSISQKDSIQNVLLTTNILLSKYLENQLKVFVKDSLSKRIYKKYPDDVFEISMSLVDIATGEVIAAPFYGNEFGRNNQDELTHVRNFNFIRHDIGSTFKPLLAFTCALKFPYLANFKLDPKFTSIESDFTSCKLLGYSLKPVYGVRRDITNSDKVIGARSAFWSGAIIDRKTFLSSSHDNYPIGLALLALTDEKGSNTYKQLHNNTFNGNLYASNLAKTNRIEYNERNQAMQFKDLAESGLFTLFSNLFGISTQIEYDENELPIEYDISGWKLLGTKRNNLYGLYPDAVNLGLQSFAGSVSQKDKCEFKDFRAFILGQQNNKWTNLELVKAYGRLVSKHNIENTFIVPSKSMKTKYLFEKPKDLINSYYDFDNITSSALDSTWRFFMADWEVAESTGNLLKSAVVTFHAVPLVDKLHLKLYCKTGTPQEIIVPTGKINLKGKRANLYLDEGLFSFVICNQNLNFPKGVAGVVHIKHLTRADLKNVEGVWSITARSFLTRQIFDNIIFYNQNRFK